MHVKMRRNEISLRDLEEIRLQTSRIEKGETLAKWEE